MAKPVMSQVSAAAQEVSVDREDALPAGSFLEIPRFD